MKLKPFLKIFAFLVAMSASVAGMIYWGEMLKQQAVRDWLSKAEDDTRHITGISQHGLSLFHVQLRSYALLFQGSTQVTQSEFINALEYVEGVELESAIPLTSLTFAERIEPVASGPADFVVTLSSDRQSWLAQGKHLASERQLLAIASSALDYPQKVVVGPMFRENGDSLVVLAIAAVNNGRKGVLMSVFDLNDFITDLGAIHVPPGLRLRLFESQDDASLHAKRAIAGDTMRPADSVTTFEVPTRHGQMRWIYYWDILPSYLGGPDRALGMIVQLGGTAIVLLIFVIIGVLLLRAQQFNRLVQLRTGELVAANQALQVASHDADAATRSKSLFLANMSHEIRTPMNAVMGLSRLALKTELTHQQRDYVGKILSSSDSLLRIINDILDFSKVEAGQLTLESIPFSIKEVLTHVAGAVSIKAQAAGLEFLFDLGAEVPPVLIGDPLRLAQIIVNLTNNAVKFTTRGEILVRIRCDHRSEQSVTLRISVSDTGMGIAPEKLATLFMPFTQADASITRKFGGSGLGLAICRQLAELMHGCIWAESEPGRGSVFTFTAEMGLSATAEQTVCKVDHLYGERALVVDDSATARVILADMLERLGLRADTADSGAQALDLLRAATENGVPYRLMLIDWNMPGLDGIETTRLIRQDPDLCVPLSVLMVTAYDYGDLVAPAEMVGIEHLLAKPVTESTLHDALTEALQGKAALQSYRRERDEMSGIGESDLARLRGARVLLVEDSPLNRQVALEFLAEAGVEVDTALNGREGVERIRAAQYDLVLMDIQMPELDGLSATRTVRADSRFADLPIIAMTAHAMSGDRELSLAAGMNDHITKPIDPDLLYAAMLRWLRHRRVSDSGNLRALQHAPALALPPALRALAEHGIDVSTGLASHRYRVAFYQRVLAMFGDEYGDTAAQLGDLLARNQHEQAHRLFHTLKSASAAIGAGALAELAREMEQRSLAALPPATEIAPLVTELERILAALRHFDAEMRDAPIPAEVSEDAGLDRTAGHLRSLLQQLDALLAQDDAVALDFLAPLRQALAGTRHGRRVADIAALVEDIEYGQARAQVGALLIALAEEESA